MIQAPLSQATSPQIPGKAPGYLRGESGGLEALVTGNNRRGRRGKARDDPTLE